MRIAEIAPPWFAVPPSGYGGVELIVALLADGLTERGHDVTLFASGGSQTKATLVSPLTEAPDPALLGNPWFDTYPRAFRVPCDRRPIRRRARSQRCHRLGDGCLAAWEPARRAHPARPLDRGDPSLLRAPRRARPIVAISESQRADNPDMRYAGMVHNGIDLASYPFREDKDDFLVYIGRATPTRVHRSPSRSPGAPVCRWPWSSRRTSRSNRLLGRDRRAAAERRSRGLRGDLRMSRRPTCSAGRARWCSRSSGRSPSVWSWPRRWRVAHRSSRARRARPLSWCENGVTGYLRGSIDDLVDAVASIGNCSPSACRRYVDEHFSASVMVKRYEQLFTETVGAGAGA